MWTYLNDNELYLENRVKYLTVSAKDMKAVFIQHFANFFYLMDHYMVSGVYVDYLDIGMTSRQNSQYWVAPFILDEFDKWIKPNRLDISEGILFSTTMQLR